MLIISEENKRFIQGMKQPCLVLADLHIKNRTWSNWAALTDDAYCSLTAIAELLQEYPTMPVLLAGDTFDTNLVSARDVLLTLNTFRCHDIWFIKGNHDCPPDSYLSVDGCQLGNTPSGMSDEVGMWGIPFTANREDLLDKLAEVRISMDKMHFKYNWLVLHQAFEHLLGLDGMWQVNLDDIKNCFEDMQEPPNVIVGHIHTRDIHEYCKGHYVLSPGALYPVGVLNVNEHRCLNIVDLAGGQIATIPLHLRDFFVLYDVGDAEEAKARLAALHRTPGTQLPPAIRVYMKPSAAIPASYTTPEFSLVQFMQQTDAQETQEQAPIENLSILDAILQDLTQNFPDRATDLYILAETLYNADDPEVVLNEALNEWKVQQKANSK